MWQYGDKMGGWGRAPIIGESPAGSKEMKMEVGERRERATVRVPFIREFYGIARRPVWRGVCACKARSFEPFIASKILGEKLGVSRGIIAKMADFKQKTGVFASKTPVLLVTPRM